MPSFNAATLDSSLARVVTHWTGDGGLALYLHYCLHLQSVAFPGLEIF